jgi:DNA repair photolyase
MRWDSLRLDAAPDQAASDTGQQAGPVAGAGGAAPRTARAGGTPALFERDAIARTFDTPGFRGMTFYEVHARSIINQVPAASRVPFRWTINPYRGCGHGCVYCFARKTHTYLDLDSGHDFDSKIVVKVNAPQLARRELAGRRWQGEHVAMGTNVDCYQRAEGRYQLMPGIIGALRDARNPFSILTKGTLILRDLDLIAEAAQVTDVGLNVSVGFVDKELSKLAEPGTPSPARRLAVCAALTDRGLGCGVLMGPVLPYLSDSPAQLAAAVRDAAAAGARSVTPIVLHLRPGAREWFLSWLDEHHPALVPAYRDLYGSGAYADRRYQQRISAEVSALARRYRVGSRSPAAARRVGRGPRQDHPARRPGPGQGAGVADPASPPQLAEQRAPVQLTLL